MNSQVFINLPVRDLAQSRAYFQALGYAFNAQFTDDTAACLVIREDRIYAMLITHEKFQTFTPKPICDATKSTEALIALSCDSRQEVDDTIRKALAAGGTTFSEPIDYGFMYYHSVQDLDGHIWEYVWMNQEHVQKS